METRIEKPIHRISRERAVKFLSNETQGRIFNAFFEKKDGTIREMRARRGVAKHLRGGDLPYDPKAHGLITVFDMAKRQYRSIRGATLISFNIGGETFVVD